MSDWRTFDVLPGETASYEVTRVLARARTAFQDVEIVETRSFGRALFLDGIDDSEPVSRRRSQTFRATVVPLDENL